MKVLAVAAAYASWESHGETMDPAVLAGPALGALQAEEGQTWVAGRNARFEGMSLADAKVLMGTLQNTEPATYLPHRELAPVELPAEFDWRTDPRAAKCPSLQEVRDQANCGSCWAFGSVEAMTDRICIGSKGAQTAHLSAQDVASCDTLGDNGCGGGIPSSVYSYYKDSGIVTGGNYGDKSLCYSYQLGPCSHHTNSTKYPVCPAEVSTPACARKCVDNGKDWGADKQHGTGGYSVCKGLTGCAAAMQQEIYQNGPITGMFFVRQSFLAYKSGVYTAGLFEPMLGGHAIKILGYGTEDGTPYWLVANSWNEEWGDHGFFKIKRGVDMCQIENSLINGGPVAGMAKLSDEVVV